MGKKTNHFTVTIKGEEVIIKRCTGCCKDKALSDYSKGVALFGRQAKCKDCNKKEYAARKAAIEGAKKETLEQIKTISFIELVLLFVEYAGHNIGDDADFIKIFIDCHLNYILECR